MRLVFTPIFRGILSRAKLPLINVLARNFRGKQKTPQTATEKVVSGRGDAASQRELLVCDFAKTKPQDVALGCSLSLKIFRYAKFFKGTLNKRSRAKLPRQTKNAAKLRRFLFGRGDATRTRNRRFWRPLLYQLSHSPKKQ